MKIRYPTTETETTNWKAPGWEMTKATKCYLPGPERWRCHMIVWHQPIVCALTSDDRDDWAWNLIWVRIINSDGNCCGLAARYPHLDNDLWSERRGKWCCWRHAGRPLERRRWILMEIVQADNEVGWFICAACFRSNLRYSPMWMRPHHVAIQNDIGTMIR